MATILISRWSGSMGSTFPIVRLFDASFAEPANADSQTVTRPEGDSLARYGANMLPVDWHPTMKSSPVFNYPYARSREALATLARNGDPDACHGHKLRYVNPASGESPMPTIGTFMQLLPAGFGSAPYRSTDGTVFVAVEGEGETVIGDTTIPLEAARHLRGAKLALAPSSQPTARPCCSASPIGRCRRNWRCGERNAAGRDALWSGPSLARAEEGPGHQPSEFWSRFTPTKTGSPLRMMRSATA